MYFHNWQALLGSIFISSFWRQDGLTNAECYPAQCKYDTSNSYIAGISHFFSNKGSGTIPKAHHETLESWLECPSGNLSDAKNLDPSLVSLLRAVARGDKIYALLFKRRFRLQILQMRAPVKLSPGKLLSIAVALVQAFC